jgi:hypothetical protein
MSRAPRHAVIRSRSAFSSASDSSVLSTSKRGVMVNCERLKRAAPRASCDSTCCVRTPDLAGVSKMAKARTGNVPPAEGTACVSKRTLRTVPGASSPSRIVTTPSLAVSTASPAPTTCSGLSVARAPSTVTLPGT